MFTRERDMVIYPVKRLETLGEIREEIREEMREELKPVKLMLRVLVMSLTAAGNPCRIDTSVIESILKITGNIDEELLLNNLQQQEQVESNPSFTIQSGKENCVILELNTSPDIFQSTESFRRAVRSLITRIVRAGQIDTNISDTIEFELTFSTPLTQDEIDKVSSLTTLQEESEHELDFQHSEIKELKAPDKETRNCDAMAAASSSSSSSSRTNFARLGHASQYTLPELWQTILEIYEKPHNILRDCIKSHSLSRGLTPSEWDKIREATTHGYGNFDIALLYKLFRNLKLDKPAFPVPEFDPPTRGYDYLTGPGPTDFTIGDELERCRNKRNNILHRGNRNITEQEMKNDFTLFKDIASRLELSFKFPPRKFVAEFDYWETCCMDEETEAEYVKNLEILIEREQEVFQRLSSLEERGPSLIQLRSYQLELAKVALNGENTIICAGTNAGKTYVAFHVIEDHLLKKPKGKVIFINRTNVRLEQQYRRACDIFTTLHFQGKIYKWQADEDVDDDFFSIFNNTKLLFLTPKSLSNHLEEGAKLKISIGDISMIILDECHHTIDRNLHNELMSFYRIEKYGNKSSRLPQVMGLTASPGTNKAKDIQSAVSHLRKLMANLDVEKLSVVTEHKDELLQYSSIPTKVAIPSTSRLNDPVKSIILEAMEYVENVFHSEKVTYFLTNNTEETKELVQALYNPPQEKRELHYYIEWMAKTKDKVEHVLLKDPEVPRLLQACIRHLELYVECLEVNSLLEIEQVLNVVTDGFGFLSSESSKANTNEERDIVAKLKDVLTNVIRLGRIVQSNPDIQKIISTIEEQYSRFGEESRFLIFVKTRATAEALADRLPPYLRSTHLTGSHESEAEGGRPLNEQLEVVDHFRNGEHLCIVATLVACEELDIQQCNVVIRYKFVPNEISSLQMRGRIRQKEGTEVLVGSKKEIEFEKVNIERQYYMNKAIEKVVLLDQAVLARDIAVAERNVYTVEELERQTAKLKISHQKEGIFYVFCKYCGFKITDGSLIRHVNGRLFIVYDKEIFTRIQRKPASKKKMKTFDGCQKRDKVYGLQCGHNWGSIIIFQEGEFVSLSQDYIKFFDREINEFVNCKKWSDLKYAIPEISTGEIFDYNRV